MPESPSTKPNRLINESSPYLLQHAYNPVDWLPWGDEALSLAKELDKPLLISIGYSSCHWCHVMEHESFEDEEIAQVMNMYFVCVKIDREERPDIDQHYMNAVQLITGGGGWPLNCFAMPDGRPIHGGTYFRRDDWKNVLLKISYEYLNNRTKLSEFADKLSKGISKVNSFIPVTGSEELDAMKVIDEAVGKWSQSFDGKWGGTGDAPKFPLPNNIEFLMRYAHQNRSDGVMVHVDLTLDRMASGGIFDQIGGGFARYSVDRIWKVPHFEKMLYDNAQLLSVYSEAFKRTNSSLYKEVVDKTVGWLHREMEDESGLFYSALDADSEGVEGKFYIWTKEELQDILGEDIALAEACYKLKTDDIWEEGQFILERNPDMDANLRALGLDKDQAAMSIAAMERRLMNVRTKRVRPGLDDKCLHSWNAMLAIGLLDVHLAFGNGSELGTALRIIDKLWDSDDSDSGTQLKRTYKVGNWKISAFLEDHAFLIAACIKAYQVTSSNLYFERARKLLASTVTEFFDEEKGAFLTARAGASEIGTKGVEYYDNVIPSANSVMFNNLIWWERFTGDRQYDAIIDRLKGAIIGRIKTYPPGYSNWMIGILDRIGASVEIAITGPRSQEEYTALSRHYMPDALIVHTKNEGIGPLFESRVSETETRLFLCRNRACELPVFSVPELLDQYRQGQ